MAVSLTQCWNKEAWEVVRELLATREHSNPEPMASDAVFDELTRFGVGVSPGLKLVGSDPIEELMREPLPPLG